MAIDPNNMLSTPEGYATPAQLKAMGDYSKALLHGSMQQPVHHWTQGLSNMVSALVGGYKQYEGGKREQVGHNWAADAAVGGPSSSYSGSGGISDAGSDIPPNTSLADLRAPHADVLHNDPETRRALMASTRAEVGGQGPDAELAYMEATLHRALAEGRPILDVINDKGYYPRTTQAKLGTSIHPEDEKRYAGHIEKYLAGSNISNLATGNESGKVRSSGAEITFNPRTGERFVAENWTKPWRDRVLASLNGPTPDTQPATQVLNPNDQGAEVSKALAFAGPGVPGAPDEGNAALASAMRTAQAGPQSAARSGPIGGGGGPSPAGPPIAGAATIDPRTLPRRPAVSDRQMRDVLRNPWVDPMVRALKLQQYYTQGQPLEVEGDYGMKYVVPGQGGQPRLVRPAPKIDKGQFGDVHVPVPLQTNPDGSITISPIHEGAGGTGPRSENTEPPTAPAGPLGIPAPATSQIASDEPPAPKVGEWSPEKATPIRLASLGGATPGMLGPAPSDDKGVQLAGPVPSGDSGPGPALLPPPPPKSGVPSTGVPYYDKMIGLDQSMKNAQEERKQRTEANSKWQEAQTTTAKAIAESVDEFPIIKDIVEHPNFKPGTGANLVLSAQKAMVTLGLSKEDLSARTEVFNKFIKNLNLTDLKAKLGGLGQVRVFEGDLVQGANANLNNSKAAIRFLLDAKERVLKREAWIAQQASEYGAVDDKFRKWVSKQYEQGLYSMDEIKDWQSKFARDKNYVDPVTGKKGTGHTPEEIEALRQEQERRRKLGK